MKNPSLNINQLFILSIAYLSFPVAIFIISWTKISIAITSIGFLFFSLIYLIKQVNIYSNSLKNILSEIPFKILMFNIFLAVLWSILSGSGDIVIQEADYFKHELVFHDLITQKWPVQYEDSQTGNKFFFCYYIAYYLPTALLAKFFGIEWANILSLIWTSLGVFFVFCWINIFLPRLKIWAPVLFVCFGSPDIIYWVFYALKAIINSDSQSLANYLSEFFDFISNHTLAAKLRADAGGFYFPYMHFHLSWSPQHAIGGWLLSALLFLLFKSKNGYKHLGILIAIGLLWSPLVVMGLLFLCLFKLGEIIYSNSFWKVLSLNNTILPLLAGFPILVYFTSHQSLEYNDFVWNLATNSMWPIFLILFLIINLYLYLVPLGMNLFGNESLNKFYKNIFISISIILTIMPVYQIGYWNDFVMRASIPSFFFLFLIIYHVLIGKNKLLLAKKILIGVLILSSIIPIIEILQNPLQTTFGIKQNKTSIAKPAVESIYYITEMYNNDIDYKSQYLADSKNKLAQWVFKLN